MNSVCANCQNKGTFIHECSIQYCSIINPAGLCDERKTALRKGASCSINCVLPAGKSVNNCSTGTFLSNECWGFHVVWSMGKCSSYRLFPMEDFTILPPWHCTSQAWVISWVILTSNFWYTCQSRCHATPIRSGWIFQNWGQAFPPSPYHPLLRLFCSHSNLHAVLVGKSSLYCQTLTT